MGTFIGLGQVILVVHMIVFAIGLRRWLTRKIVWSAASIFLDLLGFISTLIVVPAFFTLALDSESAPVMSYGAAYLIYAFATLGIFVLLMLSVFYWSGRFVGRVTQLLRIRRLGQNLGRPSS